MMHGQKNIKVQGVS